MVKNFLREMYCNNFYPTIFKITRLTNSSSTLIDHIFTNIPMLVSSGVFVTNISDHFPIFTSFTLTETNTCSNFILRRNITKNEIKLKQDLHDQNWDFISIESNTNNDYNRFLNFLFNK